MFHQLEKNQSISSLSQFITIFIYLYACMCVRIHASVYRGQKRMPDPLELDSQATVSHQSQELGTELQPFAGAVSSLHC